MTTDLDALDALARRATDPRRAAPEPSIRISPSVWLAFSAEMRAMRAVVEAARRLDGCAPGDTRCGASVSFSAALDAWDARHE